MIVYVESNFVLEIALGQEQHTSAEAILSMAEQGKIELAFPGFALSEPYGCRCISTFDDGWGFVQRFA